MSRSLSAAFARLKRCRAGNFAIITALVSPMLVGTVGGAVDVYIYVNQKNALQNAADFAALAAAREAPLKGWSKETAEAVVNTYVGANLGSVGSSTATYKPTVVVDKKAQTVSVTIDQDHYGYFVVGYFKGSPQIRVNAVARASGKDNVCVIGLDTKSAGTISLDSNSTLAAPNCAVYSNSVSTSGMKSLSNSVVIGSTICSAGGYAGSGTRNYGKEPLTDCPEVQDPLFDRPPPPVAADCTKTRLEVKDAKTTLGPGVYCGGLRIDGNADVTLSPGIYVMKDGPLVVDSNAKVSGVGVGLYFKGPNANFSFTSNAKVDLEAPSTDEMAGILFYQDRGSPETTFEIKSNYTRNLLGAVYLPKGTLRVECKNEVAKDSAWTAIVVRRLQLFADPILTLNTNYDDTTVPVPSRLRPPDASVHLTR